ncbi:MAG: nucleoid-associated protein, partial [Bacteroidales bacterium]|nr:nucleoid-associated protein [Candidatus Colimorpha onthohippi]
IATDKLDKGVLIFNQEREQGYILSLVESSSRSLDSTYWRDAFLQVCQRKDQYYNTHTEMQALKQFVTDELPQQFEGVSRADQADMLNRSVSYFKSNDSFSVEEFAREVISQPEVIESFQNFRERYQQDNDIVMQDEFAIDDDAVKRQSRSFKSVIKLDKNFHIYVHGDRDLIEQGEDERGKFYKVYYNQES